MSPSKLPDMRNHPFSITVHMGAGSERVGDRAAPTQTLTPDSSLCLMPGRVLSARQGVRSVLTLIWQITVESFLILKILSGLHLNSV